MSSSERLVPLERLASLEKHNPSSSSSSPTPNSLFAGFSNVSGIVSCCSFLAAASLYDI